MDQANQPNDEGSTIGQQQAKHVERLLSLSPTTLRHSIQPTSRNATDATTVAPPTGRETPYFASLSSHYAALSDSVTPRLFLQMCKDYNQRKLSELDFYTDVYRLFFETNGTHLMPGLREFLPGAWCDINLSWLNRGVEAESEKEQKTAREHIGKLAELVESRMKDPEVSIGSAVVAREVDLEAMPTPPAVQKKRRPLNGFRSTYRQHLSDIDITLRPNAPAPRTDSNKNSPLPSTTRPSPIFGHRPSLISTPTSTKKISFRKAKKGKSPTPFNLSESDVHEAPQSSTSSPTTPLATKPQPSLPLASSIPHLGPIYPTTRAILARSNKPYVHALCGQRFGYPAEVQRHHNGQSGRPGCWEKSGKPDGEAGQWDNDASCKVKLSDLEYVKVQEGWVVTSWGSVNLEGIREGEHGEASGGVAKGVDTGKGNKRKAVARPREVESPVKNDEETSESADDFDEYSEEPGAKRQKVMKIDEGAVATSGTDAAVRAAALGLRARK